VKNLSYSLNGDEVVSRPATIEELAAAREAALAKLKDEPGAWSMRSCWVCNGAHRRFLTDPDDGFLFRCVMGCGHVYYGGIDITEYDQEPEQKTA